MAREYKNGKSVLEPSFFCVYSSIEESVKHRVAFLKQNSNYSSNLFKKGVVGSLEKEALELKRGGYATDPNYVKNLTNVAYGSTMKKITNFVRSYYGY